MTLSVTAPHSLALLFTGWIARNLAGVFGRGGLSVFLLSRGQESRLVGVSPVSAETDIVPS